MEQGHSGTVVQVCFPVAQTAVLDGLNRQREEGRFCDLSIHVQGQVFKAHRCVLAASSPYFHDQVLLKNMSTVSIPAVMDPLAFESVLRCAYTGQLRMLRDDIVNYLTVGSVLQMWHIVDKCTELLREAKGGGGGGGGGTALVSRGSQENPESGGGTGENPSGSSSSVVLLHSRSADHQPPHHHHHQSHGRPSLSESQSPSSTNYFSPREANCGGGGGGGGGGGSASTSGSGGEGQGLSSTLSYCAPSGRSEETFLIEGDEDDEDEGLDEEEEDEEDVVYSSSRKRERGRHHRKRLALSGCDQGVGISDSFGVSSYQDGDAQSPPPPPPQKRPTYSQPSIMPRKQWVVVKTERSTDDELIVVSGGEEGGEDEEEEDKELEMARERARELERERAFSISNVRTLSDELSSRAEAEMETQVDYCQSSEDYLKYDSGLLDHPSQQHPLDHMGQGSSSSRSISALLGPLQSAAARAQLFPLDMQGNQILLYSQAALDASSPLGVGGTGLSGPMLKGPGLEHGAAHLSGQGGGLEGLDGVAPGGGAGGSGGKVFMCHCGKTFTHKSMRDRHINMHLDLRPFHCPVCAKKFKMKHHLTEHMKTHTGLKPYVCSGCGKKFMWRDSFMRHRSQCERRGIGGGGGGGGGSMEAGGSHDEQGLSPSHPLQSDGMQVGSEGRNGIGGRGGLGGGSPHQQQPSPGGGGGGGSMPCLGMGGPVSLLGIAQGLGSGIFGMGMSRGPCEDDVCEVSVDESNIA